MHGNVNVIFQVADVCRGTSKQGQKATQSTQLADVWPRQHALSQP